MEELYKLATGPNGLTVVFCLLAVIYLLYREILVWGKQMRRVETERDEWKTMAMGNLRLAADSKMALKANEQVKQP